MSADVLTVLVIAAVAAYEIGWVALGTYLNSPGRHRRVTATQAQRRRIANRVRVRVHQPIPRHVLDADNALVDAAAEKARRDGVTLLASLAQVGQTAA